MNAETRLAELNRELPPPPEPAGTYLPVLQIGDLCYLSGHIPVRPDGSLIQGKVGADLSEAEGREAARAVGLAMLASLKQHLGSLDRVIRMVKVLGVVNATPDFRNHPGVINGFSDLMVDVFGDAGRAARSAIGASSLPLNVAVEIEAIVQVATD
ncbi:MAG TPA: RidA family protein [Planctomycetaceae bacterium]|nr:RidA family protein [Planctomycetaceae bacterium]